MVLKVDDSRQDLILLPGLQCDEALFFYQIDQLADVARVHVHDMTVAESIGGLAEVVLRSAPSNFALVGFSLGGIVALEVVRQAPSRVTRLGLLGNSARPPSEAQQDKWVQMAKMATAGRVVEIARDMLFPKLVHPERLDDSDLLSVVIGMAERVGEEGLLRQLAAQKTRLDLRPTLSAIRCPTLMIAGRQDATCPLEAQEEVADAIPRAQFITLSPCGHLSPLEQPALVTMLLRWWLSLRGIER